ncbi:glycosylhydrolase family 18-2 [Trichoderma arundinaceum]|uniref:chitinase n=1 Tax=Trichoderma arundinaceum TaxID=490622 RepID=A0A395NAC1_TRIAR|nr:glycosylhydrolase family 18-2 [Trichoderma arundinaceum]
MFKLFCAALPLVARVAVAAPATISARCHDPKTNGLPFSSPVSTDQIAAQPFDPESFGPEPLDLGPIDLGSFAPEQSGSEPVTFELSDPESFAPEASSLPIFPAFLPLPPSESPEFESPDFEPPAQSPSAGDETVPPSDSKPWSFSHDSHDSDNTNDGQSRKRPFGNRGRKNVVYLTNWSIYGANYLPQNLPADEITHLLYAFAGIAGDGSVIATDLWADEQKLLGNQARDDSHQNGDVHGIIEQVFLLKQQHRHMKTLLSIGGWTASQEGKFNPAINSAAGRRRFAETAVKLLANWGFDGLDIDYEYPANQQDAENFVLLLRECREALDEYADSNGQRYHYLLTVASPAGPSHYNIMDLNGMDEYVDSWHLMAYDYAGSWDTTSGDQANVFPNRWNPKSTKFNSNEAVDDYIANGIDPSKIVFGLPLYGRSFLNTDGLGLPYSGIGQGSIEPGVWLYRDLPRPGATVHVDRDTISAYSYDPLARELVSYDNVETATLKAEYLMSRGLGGAVFWEASGDLPGERSLVRTLAREMGHLDSSRNMLDYPQSQFGNIRNARW